MAWTAMIPDSRNPRSGGVLAFLLFIVLVVAAFAFYTSSQRSRKPSPFQAVDEILGDQGASAAPDTRAEIVRMKLSELKAERAKVDEAAREAVASMKTREADVTRLRNDIADAKKRIARLKAEYREDPADEEVKSKLYDALVKLKGGEGVEGLETRQQRAIAALEAAKALSDSLARHLASLNSEIAIAESKGQTVIDHVRYGEAKKAVEKARKDIKDIDVLAESTEGEATDVAAEDEAAKLRRDAALKTLLEEP